jgi:Domain of unknown function (DUF5134)
VTPAWILDSLGAAMVVIAEVSVAQLITARARASRDASIAVSQLLTGIAVTGILVPGLHTLPNIVWAAVFAVLTAWLAWRQWRENRGRADAAVARGHYAPHLVHAAAAVYLFAALAAPAAAGSGTGGMSGMAWGATSGLPTLRVPTLAMVFALLLIAATVHDLNRQAAADGYFQVAGRRPAAAGAALAVAEPAAERLLLSPGVAKGCQVTISVIMAFTLILLI